MAITDRLRLAWSVIRNFKSIATMIPSYLQGEAQWTNPNLELMVRQGYSKNELIWRCIQERTQSASAPRLVVHSKRTGERIPDHPLQRLISRPNHRMSETDLWGITILYADLAGTTYWEQIRAGAGNTVELWPLRPDRVKPIPDSLKVVSGYEYWIPGLEPIKIPAENVVEYQVFDPLSLYKGIAPAQVASRSIDIDSSQTNYLKLFFESGGIPPGLIKTKKKLVDTDVRDIRRRWRDRYGGFQNWLDPAVLDLDAEYQKTGFSFQEMGFDVLDSRNEVRICMCFMIPPVLVGARVGLDRATFANYREARTAFLEDTMLPMFGHIRDVFQREIADEEWGDVELRWDFTHVPVLFQKQLEQRREHRADFLAGGLLLDEYRQYMGIGALPGDSGRVRVQSLAFQIIPEGELGQLVPMKQPVGVGDTKTVKLEQKSPACRQKGETVANCVSRKIPEIMRENPGMANDQAVAIAHSICSKRCKDVEPNGDKKEASPPDSEREILVERGRVQVEEFLDAQRERVKDAATQ